MRAQPRRCGGERAGSAQPGGGAQPRRSSQQRAAVELLGLARQALDQQRISGALRRIADIETARLRAQAGEIDGAVELARQVVDEQFASGDMISRGPAVTVLAESLLRRAGRGDYETVRVARDALLRLWAMLARAAGDHGAYGTYADRYRSKASALGFEGHMVIAGTM